MRRKILCFALSAMLVLTFIPQIAFAADETLNAEQEQSGVITGFAPLDESEFYYVGDPEETDITQNLPETLDVYLDGSSELSAIPVVWEALEDFDDTDFYFYSMKPVWSDDFTLSSSLSEAVDVPWITVYKEEPDNDSIEPILTEDDLEAVYIDETAAEEELGGEAPSESEDAITDTTDTEDTITTDEEQTESDDSAALFLYALANGAAGKFIDGITEDSYADTASNTAAIYRYLTGTMGLNMAAACGVMTNINAESAMSPTNLQNTYNSKFGLSDSAYTSAVDKGKGAYKTSSGKSQNFKTDSGGYGLCQWTSSGRKTSLLNRALSSGTSIGNINMQLAHLNGELQSYQQVLTTLKKVPNNAAGAYIAAAEFCLAFEIPANTVSTAASRGKNALSNYWKTYSGKSASASGTSFISLCGYSYPTAVKTGKGMDVTGYAVSNYNISSLTGTITNSSGKAVYSKTVNPGTTAYKISNLDSAMKFASLSAGTYTYTLTAKDSHGSTVKATHTFKVASGNTTTKVLGFATTGVTTSTNTTVTAGTSTSAAAAAATTVKKAYSGTYPKLPKRGYFKKGDKGTQVKNLQKYLKWYGYSIKADGSYGPKTVSIVKKFQKANGMKADGKFGKKSLAKAKTIKR